VREGDYEVLRNTSEGPVLCAMDQPQQVLNDVRSRLHCSKTCLQNDQCTSFNYKDTVSASEPDYTTYTCEHFHGYPFNFTEYPTCRHYIVRQCISVFFFKYLTYDRCSTIRFSDMIYEAQKTETTWKQLFIVGWHDSWYLGRRNCNRVIAV